MNKKKQFPRELAEMIRLGLVEVGADGKKYRLAETPGLLERTADGELRLHPNTAAKLASLLAQPNTVQ